MFRCYDTHSVRYAIRAASRMHAAIYTVIAACGYLSCIDDAVSQVAGLELQRAHVRATVNGVPITQSQVDEGLRTSGLLDTPAARQEIEAGLIVRELIRQAAEAEGLGTAPEVSAAEARARVDTENRLYVERHLQRAPVTEAQVRARYEKLVSELGPQRYKARFIAVKDEATAREMLRSLRRGTSFEDLAVARSVAVGTLPWISFKTPPVAGRTNGLPFSLANAIYGLSIGEVAASPVQVDSDHLIVKLDDRRPTVIVPYDQVQAALRQSLEAASSNEAFTRLADGLRQKAAIAQ